ncbi:ankyrin [Parathielavia hyrcaniae]|uniref:Ankyrin n=1 Tax=Parathielavia hyrcaniae TaxID=113614 RepID=A0AAN6SZW1_9PEZI|nr:ankyrin [Parathielavia hyrcaniae]
MDPVTIFGLAVTLAEFLTRLNATLEGYLRRLDQRRRALSTLQALRDECGSTETMAHAISDSVLRISGQEWSSRERDKLVNVLGFNVQELQRLVEALGRSVERIFNSHRNIQLLQDEVVRQEDFLKGRRREIRKKRDLIDSAINALLLHQSVENGIALQKIASDLQLGVTAARGDEAKSRELMGEIEGAKRPDVIRRLLETGANPNFLAIDSLSGKYPMAVSPLSCAMRDLPGCHETVGILLDNGALPDLVVGDEPPPLWKAFERGDVELATRLLDAGADVNYPFLSMKGSGRSLLGTTIVDVAPEGDDLAADEKRLELIRLALEYGANTEARAPGDGNTPMRDAVEARRDAVAVIDLLAAKNALVDVPSTRDGLTPLMRAAELGDQAVTRALTAMGAQPNIVVVPGGPTAATIAAQAGHRHLLEDFAGFDSE